MSKHNRPRPEPSDLAPHHVSGLAPAAPPAVAVWNGIRRLWMIDGVAVEPQPPAPSVRIADAETPWASGFNGPRAVVLGVVPPAVKVSA